MGADVVASRQDETWVGQAKFRSSGQLIDSDTVDEVVVAIGRYGATRAVVATNTGYTSRAVSWASKRSTEVGARIYLWNHDAITERFAALPLYPPVRHDPRPYQEEAITSINDAILQGKRRGLVLMATGLGKTRVAAGVLEQWLLDHPGSQIMVLAPTLALVHQLEAAFWPYLPKTVTTHLLTGVEKPAYEGDIVVATEQSALNAADAMSGRFGLVVVDEAHHAPADGYRALLDMIAPKFLLGMTATPWRGDERLLADVFGEPTYSVSVVEGMQRGYLARVDYRMLVDDINWEWVQEKLAGEVTIAELNRRLFVPERDEAAVTKIVDHMAQLTSPRVVIFCRSIQHAERMGLLLKARGVSTRVLHSRLGRVEATVALREFRDGTVPVLVSVDMLNEGIDVPEVNLVVFLRVTHSRRIFIQQLGRGLRTSPGKEVVQVLDFVSDIRRVAAAVDLNRQAEELADRGEGNVLYETGQVVQFENDEALKFFSEYLADVAALEDGADQAKLQFPG